jgi:hypothetical protein
MEALLARFDAAGDFRAVFVRSYRSVTAKMESAIRSSVFEDPVWMEAYDVQFAQEYFDALEAFESGAQSLPTCWKLCFELAVQKKTTVLQDLVLGMSAHILHDLPIAIHKIGIAAAQRPLRLRDHQKVDQVLAGQIEVVQDEVTRHYSWALGSVDRLFGRGDELLTGVGIQSARRNAWTMAVQLADALTETSRSDLRRTLDMEASVPARLVATGGAKLSRWIRPFRRWDSALARYFGGS